MSDLSEKINQARAALMSELGDNAQKYLKKLNMYMCRKYEHAEWELECRKLLSADKLHLHTAFKKAILQKVFAVKAPQPLSLISSSSTTGGGSNSSLSRSSRKRKRSSRARDERATFEPYDFFDFLVPDTMEFIRPPAGFEGSIQMMSAQRYCVHELFLPDLGFILGRFLIGAWEVGLLNVDDAVAEYLCTAVHFLLKNLISSIIMKRKHYKVTGEGSFYYDVGAPLKDPFLRNTVTRQKIDDGPLVLDKEITSPNFMRRTNDEGIFLSACEEVYPQKGNLITLMDLRRAFNDRNMIASHAIYSVNRERLTQMMH